MFGWRAANKGSGRNQRHNAAWGKRVALALLLLATGTSFGQATGANARLTRAPRTFAPEVTTLMDRFAGRPNEQVRVIVQYKHTPQAAALSRVQELGGRMSHHLGLVRGASFTVPAGSLAALANDSEVEFVSVDHPLKGMDDYTDAAMNVTSAVNASYDGTGIGVAVIDSGIYDKHADLGNGNKTRVVYHQDFTGTTTYLKNKQVWDLYGHGTHVAGIIGGNGNKSNGRYAGVAPNVNLVDLRVLDANGAGSDSEVIAAIQQAISLKSTYTVTYTHLTLPTILRV